MEIISLLVIVIGISVLIWKEAKKTPAEREQETEELRKQNQADREYDEQCRWKEDRQWRGQNNPPAEEICRRTEPEPEPEPETSMQRFRRQNTVSECLKRGGTLTTGEDMSAMYGVSKEYFES